MDVTISALTDASAPAYARVDRAGSDLIDGRAAGAQKIQLEADAARMRSAQVAAAGADARLAGQVEYLAAGLIV